MADINIHTITDTLNRRRLMAQTGTLVAEVRLIACDLALALSIADKSVDVDDFLHNCGFEN